MTTPSEPEYREIPLTKGKIARVSKEDYDRLARYRWCAGGSYALRMSSRKTGKRHAILMHREVLGLPHGDQRQGDQRQGDHINGDTLDNRRSNLRISSQTENLQNTRKRSDNTTGHKGVYLTKSTGRYYSQIMFKGERIHLGSTDIYSDAVNLYREAAVRLYGEFACFD